MPSYPSPTLPIAAADEFRGLEQNRKQVVPSAYEMGISKVVETPAYAATLAVGDVKANVHSFRPATLAGALTVNATAVTNHSQDDLFIFYFTADGTQRIVTFGTNFLASGTVTIPINKTAIVEGRFDADGKIRIASREIHL